MVYLVLHALLLPVSLLCFPFTLFTGTKVLKFAPATFRQREKQQLNIALNIGTEYCFYLMMVVFILCIGFAIFTKVIHK
jgi:hypothetical protein